MLGIFVFKWAGGGTIIYMDPWGSGRERGGAGIIFLFLKARDDHYYLRPLQV